MVYTMQNKTEFNNKYSALLEAVYGAGSRIDVKEQEFHSEQRDRGVILTFSGAFGDSFSFMVEEDSPAPDMEERAPLLHLTIGEPIHIVGALLFDDITDIEIRGYSRNELHFNLMLEDVFLVHIALTLEEA